MRLARIPCRRRDEVVLVEFVARRGEVVDAGRRAEPGAAGVARGHALRRRREGFAVDGDGEGRRAAAFARPVRERVERVLGARAVRVARRRPPAAVRPRQGPQERRRRERRAGHVDEDEAAAAGREEAVARRRHYGHHVTRGRLARLAILREGPAVVVARRKGRLRHLRPHDAAAKVESGGDVAREEEVLVAAILGLRGRLAEASAGVAAAGRLCSSLCRRKAPRGEVVRMQRRRQRQLLVAMARELDVERGVAGIRRRGRRGRPTRRRHLCLVRAEAGAVAGHRLVVAVAVVGEDALADHLAVLPRLFGAFFRFARRTDKARPAAARHDARERAREAAAERDAVGRARPARRQRAVRGEGCRQRQQRKFAARRPLLRRRHDFGR
mmetsp:Transcript_32406/g.109199  ORF Transcript_32406/g.109199 Transcript_32406/m.109199 type:complete len:385 (+) Transcript_32406:2018-3172(+)